MEKLLEKMGLSEKEAKVYLATLELGQESVQNIAKKADVNRPTAYFILEKLREYGLVSSLDVGKKTMFVAENPKELENLLDKEKQEIEHRKVELHDSMNQLLAIYNAKLGKPVVRYFEGADGLEALDRYGLDKLKKGSEILSILPIDVIEKQFPERRKAAVDERVKMKIFSKVIYTHEGGELTEYQNQKELREAVYIPRDEFPLDATIAIYSWGIKLYSFSLTKPHGVAIESEQLAKNMALFFQLAWKGAKAR